MREAGDFRVLRRRSHIFRVHTNSLCGTITWPYKQYLSRYILIYIYIIYTLDLGFEIAILG